MKLGLKPMGEILNIEIEIEEYESGSHEGEIENPYEGEIEKSSLMRLILKPMREILKFKLNLTLKFMKQRFVLPRRRLRWGRRIRS